MKKFVLLVTLTFSFSSFAIQLVPEARCTGLEDGKEVTVTSYVNSQKWCMSTQRDMKSSVVIQGKDSFGSAYTTLAFESVNTVIHRSEDNGNLMELILKPNSYPEVGLLKRNGMETPLSCIYVQYELDCDL